MTLQEGTKEAQKPEAEAGPATNIMLKIGLWFGGLLLIAIIALPLWASIRYRLAVGSLHDDLANIHPESAELVDDYVSSCYADIAPASIRVFEPTGGTDLITIRRSYAEVLGQRGFESFRYKAELGWSRERNDDLDADTVRFEIDESANTLTVVSDTYDIDMVTCLPLTGRK